jgi:hypothetical protein
MSPATRLAQDCLDDLAALAGRTRQITLSWQTYNSRPLPFRFYNILGQSQLVAGIQQPSSCQSDSASGRISSSADMVSHQVHEMPHRQDQYSAVLSSPHRMRNLIRQDGRKNIRHEKFQILFF